METEIGFFENETSSKNLIGIFATRKLPWMAHYFIFQFQSPISFSFYHHQAVALHWCIQFPSLDIQLNSISFQGELDIYPNFRSLSQTHHFISFRSWLEQIQMLWNLRETFLFFPNIWNMFCRSLRSFPSHPHSNPCSKLVPLNANKL